MKDKKISWIIPNVLAIGPNRKMERLEALGFKSVLSLVDAGDGDRKRFPLRDSRFEDPKRLVEAAKKIQKRLERKSLPLYVHCHVGMSRSPGVVALLMAITENITLNQAIDKVSKLHPRTRINEGLKMRLSEALEYYWRYIG